jgi:hypothetical protein
MSAVCPACGQPTTPGAVFCDNCGQNLANAMPGPMPVPQAGSIPCPSCGFGNVAGAVFCENCGSSLMAAPGQQGYVPQPPAPPVYTPPAPPAYVPPEQAYPPQPVQPQWQAPASYTVTGSFKVVATGASIPIPVGKTEILIGREDPVSGNFPDVDLDPHDGLNQGVSRQHCKLSMQGSQLVVEDLNAVNKTHLRGQQLIPGQKVPLNAGDELVLGRLRLVYYS